MTLRFLSQVRSSHPPQFVVHNRRQSVERLLVSIMFYGSAAMLFLGAFVMRYRLELILAFPLVALVMAMYLDLSFKEDSAVQRPAPG